MRFLFLPLSFLGFLLSLQVNATDSKGNFAVEGVGKLTCQQYLAIRENSPDAFREYAGWIDGYLSALNQYLPATFDLVPWQRTDLLQLSVARLCEKSREMPFFRAVDILAKGLSEKRLIEQSDRVEFAVSGADQTFFVYKEILRQAQQELIRQGYLKGAADGVLGEQTKKAFLAYQKDHDILTTGLPDQLTLFGLFVSDQREDVPE